MLHGISDKIDSLEALLDTPPNYRGSPSSIYNILARLDRLNGALHRSSALYTTVDTNFLHVWNKIKPSEVTEGIYAVSDGEFYICIGDTPGASRKWLALPSYTVLPYLTQNFVQHVFGSTPFDKELQCVYEFGSSDYSELRILGSYLAATMNAAKEYLENKHEHRQLPATESEMQVNKEATQRYLVKWLTLPGVYVGPTAPDHEAVFGKQSLYLKNGTKWLMVCAGDDHIDTVAIKDEGNLVAGVLASKFTLLQLVGSYQPFPLTDAIPLLDTFAPRVHGSLTKLCERMRSQNEWMDVEKALNALIKRREAEVAEEAKAKAAGQIFYKKEGGGGGGGGEGEGSGTDLPPAKVAHADDNI